MKLLLTGFDPWGNWDRNPSGEVAQSLHGTTAGRCEIVSVALPVVHGEDIARVVPMIEMHRPSAVVSLGLSGGAAALHVERVALNMKVVGGEDGQEPSDEPVVAGGPAAYFATLPVREMAAAMRAAGVPARLSYSAGTFLCNHIMYQVLHYLSEGGVAVPSGFIHIPQLPEQAAARGSSGGSMALADIRRGVLAGLEAVAEFLEEKRIDE